MITEDRSLQGDAAFENLSPAEALTRIAEKRRTLNEQEMRIINAMIEHCGGNKTAASRQLGMSRYALQRRLNRGKVSKAQSN